jgi:hypothetical protein
MEEWQVKYLGDLALICPESELSKKTQNKELNSIMYLSCIPVAHFYLLLWDIDGG